MKHTYIFTVSGSVREDDLWSLVRVGNRAHVSIKWGGEPLSVQFFTDANTMHEIAYCAGFPGQQLRAEIPVARRRGNTAVSDASHRLDKLRLEPKESFRRTDTQRLDWVERTGALVNRPDHMAHVYVDGTHYYDYDYRAVIDRAMREHSGNAGADVHARWSQMPGGTKRSKRSC